LSGDGKANEYYIWKDIEKPKKNIIRPEPKPIENRNYERNLTSARLFFE